MTTAATKERPKRIQLKRTKGWRMPPNTVKVARPGRWGNPYRVSEFADGAAGAVAAFRALVESEPKTIAEIRRKLRGKNLACFCSLDSGPCHADVLLEIANAED